MTYKQQRAIERIDAAKRIYADGTGIEPQPFALDLLVDLQHYCASHGINFAVIVASAETIYRRES